MGLLDWVIVGLFVLSAVGIGFMFAKRALGSTEDFFLAGRSLPWYIAGTSIVATSFSADTPLFIAGMSRSEGICSNWFWWSFAIGDIATIFFFAKLWRRTEIVTDIEFVALRYGNTASSNMLRIFKVFYDGLLVNSLVMASVTFAMTKIATIILGLSTEPLFNLPVFGEITPSIVVLTVLGVSVFVYSTLSGLYGVVYTDMIQFVLAMIGSIVLAVVTYLDASKGVGFLAKMSQTPEFKESLLKFFPSFETFNLPLLTFILFVTVTWWQSAPGKGYFVQRILATRSERDSIFASLWFNICHYIIRPWPWIIVGLLSLIYFPDLQVSEDAFPLMINKFLPVGLKGIMVASLLAAFMSTLDTHLNLGASYLVNDLYKPYINKTKDQKHYVKVSRLAQLFLTLIVVVLVTRIQSILGVYKYTGLLLSGIGTVMIARWYWWRVNAISEITALIGSLVVGNSVCLLLPSSEERNYYAIQVAITVVVVTLLWVIVTFLTSKKPTGNTVQFYKKMRIVGPGWKTIAIKTGMFSKDSNLKVCFVCWLSCIFIVYGSLVGLGKFLLHEWGSGLIAFAICIASVITLRKCINANPNILK